MKRQRVYTLNRKSLYIPGNKGELLGENYNADDFHMHCYHKLTL